MSKEKKDVKRKEKYDKTEKQTNKQNRAILVKTGQEHQSQTNKQTIKDKTERNAKDQPTWYANACPCHLGQIVGSLENQINLRDTAQQKKWDEKPRKNSVFAALELCDRSDIEARCQKWGGEAKLNHCCHFKMAQHQNISINICYLDVGLTCDVYFFGGSICRFVISRLHLHVDTALQRLNDETFSFPVSM